MEYKIKSDYGVITVKDVMIDTDGTNLEEGVDVSQGKKFLFSKIGHTALGIKKYVGVLNKWMYDYTYK